MKDWHINLRSSAVWTIGRNCFLWQMYFCASTHSFEQHSEGTGIEINDGNIEHCWQQLRDKICLNHGILYH